MGGGWVLGWGSVHKMERRVKARKPYFDYKSYFPSFFRWELKNRKTSPDMLTRSHKEANRRRWGGKSEKMGILRLFVCNSTLGSI